ncbi:MAG TPA: ThuA domain-containing protein [Actinomycetota bacterium]|nr:ThuA domain-containing protein [Actinomycetota bacterium]
MTRSPRVMVALAALVAALLPPSAAAADPPHVVVFSATFGYRHAGIAKMVSTIRHLADVSGDFTVEHVTDPGMFGEDLYARADAVMFLQTTGSPPFAADQRERFLRFFSCGGAFIGVHAASDSGGAWEGYTDLLGARFAGHPHFGSAASYQGAVWEGAGQPNHVIVDVDAPMLTDATIHVEDRVHGATAPWHGAPTFRMSDEFYRYQTDPRKVDGLKVLLSLENESDYWPVYEHGVPNPRVIAGRVNAWLGYTEDTPLAWTKTYGAGRVFYTNLGHNPGTWDRVDYQSHLLGGIRWATEIAPAEVCVSG